MSKIHDIRQSVLAADVDLDGIVIRSRELRGLNVLRQRVENAQWAWCVDPDKSFDRLAKIRRALSLIEEEIEARRTENRAHSQQRRVGSQLTFNFDHCQQCGVSLDDTKHGAKFCSPKCRMAAHRHHSRAA